MIRWFDFITYILSLDNHQLVFDLYLSWVKEGKLILPLSS